MLKWSWKSTEDSLSIDFDVWSFYSEYICCWANIYQSLVVVWYDQVWNIKQKVYVKVLVSLPIKYNQHNTVNIKSK